MFKTKKILVSIIIGLVSLTGVYAYPIYESLKLKNLDQETRKTVEAEDAALPIKIADKTFWVAAEYDNFKVKYTYITDRTILNSDKPEYKSDIEKATKDLCKKLEKPVKKGIEFSYVYKDAKTDLSLIDELIINKDICLKIIN